MNKSSIHILSLVMLLILALVLSGCGSAGGSGGGGNTGGNAGSDSSAGNNAGGGDPDSSAGDNPDSSAGSGGGNTGGDTGNNDANSNVADAQSDPLAEAVADYNAAWKDIDGRRDALTQYISASEDVLLSTDADDLTDPALLEQLQAEIDEARYLQGPIPGLPAGVDEINRQVLAMTATLENIQTACEHIDLLTENIAASKAEAAAAAKAEAEAAAAAAAKAEAEAEAAAQLDLAAAEAVSMQDEAFFHASDFSSGLAWVQYDKNGVGVTAAINTAGEQVFMDQAPVVYMSPFDDGAAFVITCADAAYHSERGFSLSDTYFTFSQYIVAANGEITYRPIEGERILCAGNGKFVTARHVSNFDENYWTVGTIDKSGKTINEYTNYSWTFEGDEYAFRAENFSIGTLSDYEERYRYAGEGIFILNGDGSDELFYYDSNANTYSVMYGQSVNVFGQFTNGLSYGWSEGDIHTGGELPYVIDTEGERTGVNLPTARYRETVDKKGGLDLWPGAISDSLPKEFAFSEGLIYWDHSYVDVSGDRLVDIANYTDKAMFGGPFSGGYAVLLVEGVDSRPYFTIINIFGNEQFPIRRVDSVNFNLSEGYAIALTDGVYQVVDVSGNVIREIDSADGKTVVHPVREGYSRVTAGDCEMLVGIDSDLDLGVYW